MKKWLYCLFLSFVLPLLLCGQTMMLDSLMIELSESAEDTAKVKLLHDISWEYSRVDVDKMQDYTKQALALSNVLDYPKGRAKSFYYLAVASLYKGHLEASYDYGQKAYDTAAEINDQKTMASAVNVFGIYHHEKGNLVKALEHYLEGLKYSALISDTISLSIGNFNIGILYEKMEQKERAASYFERAAALGKATNDYETICMSYSSLGAILEKEEKYDEALAYYQDGLEIAMKHEDKFNTAHMLMGMAQVQSEKGNVELALSNAQRASQYYMEIGNEDMVPYAFGALAEIYNKMEDYDNAVRYAQESMNLVEKHQIRDLVPDLHKSLSEAYAGLGQYEKAYRYHVFFQESKDSIVNESLAQRIAEQEASFRMTQQATENQLLKEKQARQDVVLKNRNTIAVATILGLLLVSCLALALFVAFRQKLAYNRQLKDEVKNRTAELETSNAALIKSNTELERFAYIASHDLKEPLRNIVSFSKLIDRRVGGTFDDTTRDYLEFVINNAKQMNILIEDVLEFSRIGHTNVSFEDVEMVKIIRQVEMALGQMLAEKNAAIYFELLPRIYSKESQIYLLFKNLIENAIKYNNSDLPTVRVRYIDQGEHHLFMVEDNGIGIAQEYQDQIFHMFKRLHTRDHYKGSGLGLAICKKIVDFLGGKIWVESKEGSGSRFCIQMPIDPKAHRLKN
ncbi:MAG: ATP-binding protein, partial [Bacteroidota bacterium]